MSTSKARNSQPIGQYVAAGRSVVQLRYRYRLTPDLEQRAMLAKTFGRARTVYNDGLRLREQARLLGGKYISNGAVQKAVITDAKKTPERAWLTEVASVALIQSVNDLTASISQQADSLGTSAAQQFYQAGVDAAQGLVNGLLAQQEALDAAAKKLADALVKQVKKSLGIKSPSTVMASPNWMPMAPGEAVALADIVTVYGPAPLMAVTFVPIGMDPAAGFVNGFSSLSVT